MVGLWSDLSVPRRGWELIDVEDLGCDESDFKLCEACGKKHVRYVHHLRHPSYAGTVGVGCVCGAKMQHDEGAEYIGRELEKRLVRRDRRRRTWLTRKWALSSKGNVKMKAEGWLFILCNRGRFWEAFLKPADADDFKYKARFATEAEAKLALFDVAFPNKIAVGAGQ